jgi:hypothetical protein
VDPRGARACDRIARARMQNDVLRDQRAVEIARDRFDLAREVGRKLQP